MYFSGRVNAVLFEEPAQGFYILKVLLDSDEAEALVFQKQQVTVRGHVQGLVIKVGTWFGFEAEWKNHSKYGKQLAITKAPVFKGGWDPDNAEKVLVSHGVGSRVLLQIRGHFGDDEFLKVLADKAKLEEVPGVNSFTAMYIVQRWETVQAYFKTLDFLNDLGLPTGKVREVWTVFGDDAEHVLSSNPWALVRVDGISFHQADAVAMKLGLDVNVPDRIRGAVLYSCKNQRNFGHLYMTTGQMFGEIQSLIPDVDKKDVATALTELHKTEDIILDRDTKQGTLAIYEPSYWKMEQEAASLLLDRQKAAGFRRGGLDKKPYISQLGSVGPKTEKKSKLKRPRLDKVVETAIQEWGEAQHLKLSDTQKEGVLNALTQPVSVLTGLPGTGKTTSLRAVVNILQEAGVTFLLCAPTGIAAKNLAKLTGAHAYTIHRAFSAKGKSDEKRESTYAGIVGDSERDLKGGEADSLWGYDPDNPHPAQVVVVDEASMLDQHLIFRLLTCTSPQCRMVIVGDAAQLPSVGPGNVLRDLINSGNFPVVNLTEIFRQKDTSDIVFAAHDIYHGKVPECQPPSDFSLVQVGSEEKVQQVIMQLAEKLYDKRRNFQILSPRHAGTVGVTSLNVALRELLNPQRSGLAEARIGQDMMREDDRIMVVKNNYRLGVYNGDVGKVSRIDRKAKEVELKIFGDPPLFVRVPFKDVPRLVRLAYTCTVHKAQGLEYDVIVMPIVDSFSHQLQRNLLYTAVTRAKQKVILVGTHSALARAVANDREDQRNTLFKERIVPDAA